MKAYRSRMKGYKAPKKSLMKSYKNLRSKIQSKMTKGIVKYIGDTPAGRIIQKGLKRQKIKNR